MSSRWAKVHDNVEEPPEAYTLPMVRCWERVGSWTCLHRISCRDGIIRVPGSLFSSSLRLRASSAINSAQLGHARDCCSEYPPLDVPHIASPSLPSLAARQA